MSGRSMNLMDLLSSDSSSLQHDSQINSLSAFYENTQDTPELPVSQEINPSMVFYLPTEMTQLQKDMSEAVIQMFLPVLQSELFPQRARSNINSLLSAPDDAINGTQDQDKLHRAKIISLIYNQLLTISMHPSLVVDHFISKGLLLSSTKAGLCSLSGKLTIFNEIVDTISEEYEVESPSVVYNLLVIAKTVKELELIEGLVIGKKLSYVNVSSGKSLFEEPKEPTRSEKDDLLEEDQPVDYKHKHRHYASRQAGKDKPASKMFTLHLITSRHLCSSFTSNIKFDLMVSFDSDLDTSSPSIELLRRNADFHAAANSQIHIPILIPVPIYSVEHISWVIPKPESEFGSLSKEAETDWWRLVLRAFIGNRYRIFEGHETVNSSNCGIDSRLLHDLAFSGAKDTYSSPYKWMDKYTRLVNTDLPSDKLRARLDANYLLYLQSAFGCGTNGYHTGLATADTASIETYEDFKRRMANFLYARITEINILKTDALKNIVPRYRADEEKRQAEIDHDEEQVGENYRKLRKLNEELAIVEKRFTRVESENQKLSDSLADTQQILNSLQSVLENEDDTTLDEKSGEQVSSMKSLEEEKALLLNETSAINKEIEEAREEYQQKSASALSATEVLQSLEKKRDSLRKRSDGPGMSTLPALAREKELATYRAHLHQLEQETSFLEDLYTSRFDKVIKERSSGSETSSLTPTNRASNKLSRAPTPLQSAKKTAALAKD